jgi:hypothetical protein
MKNFSDYDIRQIFLLKTLLEIYIKNNNCNKRSDVYKLIRDIKALLKLMNSFGEDWCDDMRSLWFDLEIAYAISDSEGRDFVVDEKKEIENAVVKMKEMVDILISENGLQPEDEI